MKKNVANQSISFQMMDASGDPVTSGTPTVYITGDNGTQASGSGSSTHKGNGEWSYVPTQAETNYDHIVFSMVLSDAFSQTVNVYTTYPQTGDVYPIASSETHGNAALKTLIDAIDAVVDAIKVVTDNLPDSGALSNLATLETRLTAARAGYLDKLNVSGTLAHSDAASTYKADISGLATEANQITITGHLTDIKGGTFSGATDSLEAIRDRGDAAWITGGGGTAPTVEEIRAEMDSNSTQLAAIVADTNEIQSDLVDGGRIDLILDELTAQGDTNEGKIDTIDTVVDAIKIKTDNLPADPADQSAVEAAITTAHATTDGNLATIASYLDTEISSILEDTGTTIPELIAALNDPDVSTIVDAVLDEVLVDVEEDSLNIGEDITVRKVFRALFNRFYRLVSQTSSFQVVYNDSDVPIASMAVSDDGTTQRKGGAI